METQSAAPHAESQSTSRHSQEDRAVLGNERSMVARTGKDLSGGEYPGIILPSPYWDVLGEPRMWFKMLVYGSEGSGKSTFVTGVCKSYLPYARRMGATVLYCSSEEGPSDTTADRIKRLGVNADDLLVTTFSNIEELKDVIEAKDAQFVVLDSANALPTQKGKGVELMDFCQRQGRAITVIAHQNSKGEASEARGMRHECGVQIKCEEDTMSVGRAQQWGLDVNTPERRSEEPGEVKVHYAKDKKNRFGGRLPKVPIPMKESEIRESVPQSVIDRRIRKLKQHNQWPLAGDSAQQGRRAGSEDGPRANAPSPSGPSQNGTSPQGTSGDRQRPNETTPHEENPHGDGPHEENPHGEAPQKHAPEAHSEKHRPEEEPAPTGGKHATESTRQNSPSDSTPSKRTDGPMSIGLSLVRANPADKVDLEEKPSFTLRELIENNGNAARSISYLNKFVGWERGCVAEVSTKETPDYRSEEGGELVDGRLLSFTYERFPKSTSRPDAVAVTRMYFNDRLEAVFCADTAKETIVGSDDVDGIVDEYGDLEIKIKSQEHLEDAFGVEEYRRLASEIPKKHDEDKGTPPEELDETDARADGFDTSELGQRGHVSIERGLVDKRVINLAEEAAQGEFEGMSAGQGRVMDSSELPTTALHGVQLFDESFIFYPAGEVELEVSTGDTFYVGDQNTMGDGDKAETLMAYNFGLETQVVEGEGRIGKEPEGGVSEGEAEEGGVPLEETGEEETGEEEEETTGQTEEETGEEEEQSAFDQILDGIEELRGDMTTGVYAAGDGPAAEDGTDYIDSQALSILFEVARNAGGGAMGDGQSMDLAGVEARVEETDLELEKGHQSPVYTLSVEENDEGIDSATLLLALRERNYLRESSVQEPEPDEPEEDEPETVDDALRDLADEASSVDEAPGGYGFQGGETFVGGDAIDVLATVADDRTQKTVTFVLAGEAATFRYREQEDKYIGSEENGAFRLMAENDAAEDIGSRGLVQALESGGAMRIASIETQIVETGTGEDEPDEPASSQEPEGDDPMQQTMSKLGEISDAIEDLPG